MTIVITKKGNNSNARYRLIHSIGTNPRVRYLGKDIRTLVSVPPAKIKTLTKGKLMSRYQELMLIAKGEYMTELEFEELLALTKKKMNA